MYGKTELRGAKALAGILMALAVVGILVLMGRARANQETVVPVDKSIEHGGITVGLKNVRLTRDATILEFWHDEGALGPAEPIGAPSLDVGGQPLRGIGGSTKGSNQFTFPSLPSQATGFVWEYGPFIGTEPNPVKLSIPLGSMLQQAVQLLGEPGQLPLRVQVQVGQSAYSFTGLSVTPAGFSLEYGPADESASWRPLTGPGTSVVIRDDSGRTYKSSGSATSFDRDNGFAFNKGVLHFVGAIDPDASTWILEVERPGVITRGPWRFEVVLP